MALKLPLLAFLPYDYRRTLRAIHCSICTLTLELVMSLSDYPDVVVLNWQSVTWRTMLIDNHATRWMHFKLPGASKTDIIGEWRYLVDGRGDNIPLIGRPDGFDLAVSGGKFQARWDVSNRSWVLCHCRDNLPYISGFVHGRHVVRGVKGRRYVTPSWPGLPPLPPNRRSRTH